MCLVTFQINEMRCLVVGPGVGSENFRYETQSFDALIKDKSPEVVFFQTLTSAREQLW